MLRSSLIGLVSSLAIITSANAADMYKGGGAGLKDAPEYVPGVEWSGVYLGVGGGGGATSSDLKVISGGTAAETNGIGGMGGFGTAQIGYDQRLSSRFLAGAFADFDLNRIDSKVSVSNLASFPFNLKDSWTVGGRAGYLLNPNTMAYALAGYTQAKFDLPAGTHNATFEGYTVGAGLETHLSGNFFLKAEYRFTGLDKQTIYEPSRSLKVTDQPDVQTGRLVLSYKLNPFGSEPLK